MANATKKVTTTPAERPTQRPAVQARMYMLDVPGAFCDAMLCSRSQAVAIADFVEEISGIHVEVRSVRVDADFTSAELHAFVSPVN
ncbi:MAG: hypothetical protein NTW52_08950 [Planctomycetota bacterium]|nr:hypothetical protein [Planctomycetota bacterium]